MSLVVIKVVNKQTLTHNIVWGQWDIAFWTWTHYSLSDMLLGDYCIYSRNMSPAPFQAIQVLRTLYWSASDLAQNSVVESTDMTMWKASHSLSLVIYPSFQYAGYIIIGRCSNVNSWLIRCYMLSKLSQFTYHKHNYNNVFNLSWQCTIATNKSTL